MIVRSQCCVSNNFAHFFHCNAEKYSDSDCGFTTETVLTCGSYLSSEHSLLWLLVQQVPGFIWGQKVYQNIFCRKRVTKAFITVNCGVKPDSTFGKASNTGDWATSLQIQFGPRQYVKYKPSSSCWILIHLKNVVDRNPSLSAGAMNNENVDFPLFPSVADAKQNCRISDSKS